MNHQKDRGPGVKIPPPVITGCCIAAGFFIHKIYPVSIVDELAFWPGYALLGVAVLIAILAVIPFFQFKTHIEPWKPSTTLIQSGIYQYSRNPIYLAFVLSTIGIGLILSSLWIVFMSMPLIVLLKILVIDREEQYLPTVFGSQYTDYCLKVRRWI